MKKLMTVMAAAATALFAIGAVNGDPLDSPLGTSFEGYGNNPFSPWADDTGNTANNGYWYMDKSVGADTGTVLTSEVAAVTVPRPDMYSAVENRTALSLDTSSPLFRTVATNDGNGLPATGATIGTDGIYLDTLVKFTAADDVFGADALAAGDKIAISYVEQSDEVENPITNFVIRAGYVNGSVIVPTNYVANAPANFDKDAWHRLTVRTLQNVGSAVAPVAFVVYVDQVELGYSTDVAAGDAAYVAALNTVGQGFYNAEKHQLFPSALGADDAGGDKIYAAAFSGTGAIDDVVFTTEKPSFIHETVTVSVTWDEHVKSLTLNGIVVDVDEGTSTEVEPTNGVVDVVATFDDGYVAGKYSVRGTGAWDPSNNAFTNLSAGAECAIVSMLPLFEVDGAFFDDVEDAIEAAVAKGTQSNPATVKLLANYAGDIEISDSGYVIIDLAGKNITGTEYGINNSGATLKIINSTATIGHVSGATGAMIIGGGSTTINNGVFDAEVVIDTEEYELKLFGGQFLNCPVEIGDTSFYLKNFVDSSVKATAIANTNYFQVGEGGEQPTGYDSGDGEHTFTIAADREAALKNALPAGKTLASAISETSSMTYAQAYALGLWSENSATVADLDATISVGADGKVTVSLATAPATGYLVTCKVYEKASLTAEWPTEAKTTYAYGSEQAFTPGSATAGFYKVAVVISNSVQQ